MSLKREVALCSLVIVIVLLAALCGCTEGKRSTNSRDPDLFTGVGVKRTTVKETAPVAGLLQPAKPALPPDSDPYLHKTELMKAVEQGQKTRVVTLLQAGEDPATQNFMGRTALFYAVTGDQDDPEMIEILLKSGAVPNARDITKSTPLIEAAAAGKVKCVLALLAAGAWVNAKSNAEETALGNAVKHGYPDLQRLLLAAGAKFDEEDLLRRQLRLARGSKKIAL